MRRRQVREQGGFRPSGQSTRYITPQRATSEERGAQPLDSSGRKKARRSQDSNMAKREAKANLDHAPPAGKGAPNKL